MSDAFESMSSMLTDICSSKLLFCPKVLGTSCNSSDVWFLDYLPCFICAKCYSYKFSETVKVYVR